MTRDDIIRMAREAQLGNPYGVGDSASVYVGKEDILRDLERFAALVADAARGDYHEGWEEGYKAGAIAEREACAAVADGMLLEKAGDKASVVYSGDVGAAIKRRESH